MQTDTRTALAAPDHSLLSRRVWLTFDDGPHAEHTPNILDSLKARGTRALFFVVGRNVERLGKTLLQRACAEGHFIGNHTDTHPDLTTLSEARVRQEITRAESSIAEFLGPGRFFRPPFGASNATVDRVIGELGYHKVSWNIDSRDWDSAYWPNRWVEHAIDRIPRLASSVVLAHDIHRTTAEYLVELIERIERIGGVFCEPSEAMPCVHWSGSR